MINNMRYSFLKYIIGGAMEQALTIMMCNSIVKK